ncbi:hypothetical protein ACOMHN_027806 [Nucella lapillus]
MRPDRESGIAKDVYVEIGKRKIPRESTGRLEEEARRKLNKQKRKTAITEDRGSTDEVKTCQSLVDLEDSTLFEDDLSYVEPKPEFPGPYDPERVRQLYSSACSMLNIVPCSRYIHGLNSGRVTAGHQGMGPLGSRAIAISLLTNLTVTELLLPDNKLGPEGIKCMARLIHGNEVIKVLDISDNELGRDGARILAAAIKENDSIQQINAAGNKFDDKTGIYFEEALKHNSMIKQLDLSRNQFSEVGAIHLGRGLEENDTVTHLDLSYNNIRRYGIKGIARMLAHNRSLMQLDLSWNGIDPDMAKLMGDGLNNNSMLSVLNLTGCRLNAEAIMKLLGQMKENKVLKTLQSFSFGPLNTHHSPFVSCLDLLLVFVSLPFSICFCLPRPSLSPIDMTSLPSWGGHQSVTVSQDLLELAANIAKTRPGFMLNYRGLLSITDHSKNMLEVTDLTGGDPLGVIISYARQKNLRLMDIFARFDVDKSGTMTRQELIMGVADAGIPLSIKQLDKLVAKLDKDGDGEIDFSELLEGYRKFLRNLHRQGKVARVVLKGEAEMFPGLVVARRRSSGSMSSTSMDAIIKVCDDSEPVRSLSDGDLPHDDHEITTLTEVDIPVPSIHSFTDVEFSLC